MLRFVQWSAKLAGRTMYLRVTQIYSRRQSHWQLGRDTFIYQYFFGNSCCCFFAPSLYESGVGARTPRVSWLVYENSLTFGVKKLDKSIAKRQLNLIKRNGEQETSRGWRNYALESPWVIYALHNVHNSRFPGPDPRYSSFGARRFGSVRRRLPHLNWDTIIGRIPRSLRAEWVLSGYS